MSDEIPRVFIAKQGCPYSECRHYSVCQAAMMFRGEPVESRNFEIFVPELIVGTGGDRGWVKCESFLTS